jgi:hypothetical protein
MSAEHKDRLDHHDRMIEKLVLRIEGVESVMTSMTQKMDAGFGEMMKKFSTLEGKQGPGIFESMKMVAIGGSIVTMTAGAIFYLVSSAQAPELTKIKVDQARVESSALRRDSDEHAELKDLRRQHRERVEATIESLKTAIEDLKLRVGWQAVVRK